MLAAVNRYDAEDPKMGKKSLFAVGILFIPGGIDASAEQDRIDLERLLVWMKNSGTCFVSPVGLNHATPAGITATALVD